jgi:hypothetical protein
MKSTNFQLIAQCLDQLQHHMPLKIYIALLIHLLLKGKDV